jgi:O-antigen/teichoic acid export membrane protein
MEPRKIDKTRRTGSVTDPPPKSPLGRNAAFSLAQSLVVTIAFLFVYRILLSEVGPERVGVWSVMLSATALLRIGDVSGAGALARFVAIAIAHGDKRRAKSYIHTTSATSLALNGFFGVAVVFLAPSILPRIFAEPLVAEGNVIAPFIALTMITSSLGSGVCSALDGCQRADQRAIVVAVSASLSALFAAALIPSFGLVGFAVSQVLQQALSFVLGWLALRRALPNIGWGPVGWNHATFIETLPYSAKLQAVSAANAFVEPVAKFALNATGGPGIVTFYDLASRIVIQLRALVIAGATPLVPVFAAGSARDAPRLAVVLERSTRALTLAAFATALASLLVTPPVALLVLGGWEPTVLKMNVALTLGWSLNILSAAHYLAAQGRGIVLWNFAGTAAIALCTTASWLLLPAALGPSRVIFGIVVGLAFSAMFVVGGNGIALQMSRTDAKSTMLLPVAALGLIACCGLAWLGYRWLLG